MENCIFCKIAENKVPSYKVYEDKNFVAFLSIRPITDGHVLVIPKRHARWVWDVSNIGEYFEVSRKIALAQRKAFGIEQVISYVIGEEVPHAHVWLVPKHNSDSLSKLMDISNTKEGDYSPEKFKRIAEMIKKEVK
jgi:histidine triad (HIT) family protein